MGHDRLSDRTQSFNRDENVTCVPVLKSTGQCHLHDLESRYAKEYDTSIFVCGYHRVDSGEKCGTLKFPLSPEGETCQMC